jgi:hypothetical protein
MAALQPNFQLTRLCLTHRDHRLIVQCPQSLPCCGALTAPKPSCSEGNKAAWNRASAPCLVSLREHGKAPLGRKASCCCKLFNDDAAGEYGEAVGTSWLHCLMDHAGIDTSHAQVRFFLPSRISVW